MRSILRPLLAALVLAAGSRLALATASFGSAPDPLPQLNFVKVTIGANGSVGYQLAGSVAVGGQTFTFSGVGAYDPASRKTSERLTEQGGNVIESSSSCLTDPWQTFLVCSGVTISSKGYNSAAMAYITNLRAPLSAQLLNGADRDWIKGEYQKAVDAARAAASATATAVARKEAEYKAKLGAPSGIGHLPTPTPGLSRVITTGKVSSVGPSSAPPPPQYPAYGAIYTPGNVPSVKANQTITVPVTIQNTSSQNWPANGVFRLSYHWNQGGAAVVFDGQRTVLPTPVNSGGSISLNSTVKAPPGAGSYTLQWDMVQENVAWFSWKGVPTKDQNVNVTP